MTVLSIAGFALGLNTMRDRGGVVLLTKVFWRFGTLVERVSETNYDLHSTFKKGSIIRNMLSAILFKQVCMYVVMMRVLIISFFQKCFFELLLFV